MILSISRSFLEEFETMTIKKVKIWLKTTKQILRRHRNKIKQKKDKKSQSCSLI